MLAKDDVTTLIENTVLWWASHWNALANPTVGPQYRVAPLLNEDRLDDLIVTFGLELADSMDLKSWGKFEKALAILASELRFRVFENREDAVHAALNMASTLLDRTGYRPKANWSWSDFETDFKCQLRNPQCYDTELNGCIRKHFERP